MDMKLEVAVIPVSDVERAKSFYGKLGCRLDADFVVGDAFRAIQFTPPGSPCSIHFGKGITAAAPGSACALSLIVSDIEAARADLTNRGAAVSEIFHRLPGEPPSKGLDPMRRSYAPYATFADPDGNEWLLQEVTARLPDGWTRGPRRSRRSPSSSAHCAAPRLRTASTRSASAIGMSNGRTGTPAA